MLVEIIQIIFLPLALASTSSSLLEAMEQSNLPQQENLREEKNGRAIILVFERGNPKEGVRIEAEGKQFISDVDGVIRLNLPRGTHTITPEGFAPFSLSIVSNEETEVMVNLLPPDQIDHKMKAPSDKTKQTSSVVGASHSLEFRFVSEKSNPVQGVSLMINGEMLEAKSNAEGKLKALLPIGDSSLVFFHPSFETITLQDTLSLSPNPTLKTLGANPLLSLSTATSDLEEMVVLAPKVKGSVSALVEVRRNSSGVSDVLGSEQMSKQGDSDAGGSLRRVTGLTLVGGKYVYVRGLGERYSSVTLNGASLPSPEPSRRVVPLDLFPTSVLESVIVQKSFTPTLPGEFGGGLIQLQTKSLPDKPFLKVSTSTNSDGREGLIRYEGGRKDFMGEDDGTRALPEKIKAAFTAGKKLEENNPPLFTNGFSAEELAELGRSLSVKYNTKEKKEATIPSLSIAGGRMFSMQDLKLGFAASGSHGSTFSGGEKSSAKYDAESAESLALFEQSKSLVSEREVKSSGTLDLGGNYKEQNLQATFLLVRHSTDTTEIKDSYRPSDSVKDRKITNLEWVERELFTKQLTGKHGLPLGLKSPLLWQWQLTESIANRSAPDAREYTYIREGDVSTLLKDNNGNKRNWSELKDTSRQVSSQISQSIDSPLGQFQPYLGFSQIERSRIADVYRLHMRIRSPDVDLSQPPDSLLGRDSIEPGKIELTNLTESADSMAGTQTIDSLFFGSEWNPSEKIGFATGMRREEGKQEVKTYYYFQKEKPTSYGGMTTTDWLPSHSLTWKPAPSIRARLAYSETVARPEFRELSTVAFIDDESGYETIGYDKLKGTVIRNYDHRWEFYPSPEESASLGLFYKEFQNPIEEIFEPSPNLRKTFRNVEKAKNAGIEIDGRLDLRRISRGLRRWSLIGNISVIRSRVELGAENSQQTSKQRPLQGQSPWIANAQIQYDRPAMGRSFGILYNLVGPRITEVGTNFRPDIYEQPFHQLDFVASERLGKVVSLGFRAKNLLDPEATAKQADKIVRKQKKGRSFYVSLSANF